MLVDHAAEAVVAVRAACDQLKREAAHDRRLTPFTALDDGALGEQPGVQVCEWSPIMKASLIKCGLVGAVSLALSTSVASAQAGGFGSQQQPLSGESAVILARVGGGSVHGGGMGAMVVTDLVMATVSTAVISAVSAFLAAHITGTTPTTNQDVVEPALQPPSLFLMALGSAPAGAQSASKIFSAWPQTATLAEPRDR